MTASAAGRSAGVRADGRPGGGWLRAYFWSDAPRRVQTVLGLLWLLDGGLQFQSFMYSRGFVQMLAGGAQGQPGWLADSINWGARLANGHLTVFNSLFAVTQVLIGLGLLYRPLVKPALAGSFIWALVVWWFGEAFGMLFMGMAQPLTGAPGGVLMYALIGLTCWPNGRPGGLIGVRGAKTLWCVLWSLMAYLWLLASSSSANATRDMLTSVPTGIGPLDHLQRSLASAAAGHGLVIALVLGALSLTIAVAVVAGWRPRAWLWVSIVLSLVYWVIPQGLGGIFAGGATDPNTAPLFVLLAAAMFPLVGPTRGRDQRRGPALVAACCLVLAGCGSSAGLTSTSRAGSGSALTTATTSGSGMAGMAMGGSGTTGSSMGGSAKPVNGIKPIPTQTLGVADWQQMKIQARAMTAVPFVIFNGTKERMVVPPKHTSFHLMVTLDDARTNYPIPYAGVWATIRKAGKVVFDERQWPMLSEYMGPHYGNNVTLPGAGRYQLSLLVSPPVAARHVEYKNVWLKPHRVNFAFNWKPGA